MGDKQARRGWLNSDQMLESVARKFKLTGVVDRHRLFALWPQIVGQRLNAVCRPDRLTGGTLVVRVIDSVWGQDLRMHTDVILAQIAKQTGSDRVTKLRIVTGPIAPSEPAIRRPRPLHDVAVETADIDAALSRSALRAHPRLKEALGRLWATTRRLAKRREEDQAEAR